MTSQQPATAVQDKKPLDAEATAAHASTRMTESTGRAIERLLAVLVVIATVIVLYFAQPLMIPIAAAVLLSLLFKPVVRKLWNKGVRPIFSAAVVVAGLTAALVVLLYMVVDPVSTWIDTAPQKMEQIDKKLHSLKAPFERLSEATERLDTATSVTDKNKEYVQPVEVRSGGVAAVVLNQTTGVLTGLLTTLMLTFFLLAASDEFLTALVEAIPRFRDKRAAVAAFRQAEHNISQYLVTRTLINVGLGMATTLVMWALGMPSPLLWGLIAATFNFIPYLGPFVALLLVAGSSILVSNNISDALLPPLAFLGLNFLEGIVLCPLIIGKQLQLNSVVVFISLMFWAWLWGVPGAFMAVPLTVCIRIALDHIEGLRPYGRFLAARSARVEHTS